jgi:uridine kinase
LVQERMRRVGRAEATGGPARGFVVAVSGTSGGGKTTLVKKTAALLGDVVRLHFDDYIFLGNDPSEIRAWLEAGADPDHLKTPRLADDLRRLRSGEATQPPGGSGVIEPAEFVLLEEPFGRARGDVAPYIDLAAHIELPADVALARRIVRAIEEQEQPDPEQMLAHILHDLKAYLLAGRESYEAANRAARESADVVLDGLRPADELAAELVAEIRRRLQK